MQPDIHVCLKVKNVSYSYEAKQVLNDVNFDLHKGEFVGITGSNGTGKSTLVKLILGLLPMQKGKITFCRESGGGVADIFGYVSQKSTSFNFSFPATVEEVVAANYRPVENWFKTGRRAAREAVSKQLKRFGIESLRKRRIGSLSGGEQQKVFVARAMINAPEILFLDEPTNGIDAASSQALYSLLKKLNKQENLTILMISHDIPSLVKDANRILHLDSSGRLESFESKGLENQMIRELYGI